MGNIKLITSIAVAALLAGATGAMADSVKVNADNNIIQETTNNNPVVNLGIIGHTSLTGKGASSTVGANGSMSAVSVSNISDNTQTVNVSAEARNITQTTTNNGNVFNAGAVLSGPVTGRGTAVSVTATGAASVVSVSSIK